MSGIEKQTADNFLNTSEGSHIDYMYVGVVVDRKITNCLWIDKNNSIIGTSENKEMCTDIYYKFPLCLKKYE